MKIVTYNVNGIRAAIKKGLVDWVVNQNVDVICFQETKSQPEQVDMSAFEAAGYHAYWHSAEKKGYSGVLTLSKFPASQTVVGMGNEKYDREGRVIRTDINGYSIFNCYFPSGSSGEERHQYKMEFLSDFDPYIDGIRKDINPIIVVGDYNIVHTELDIHNPKRKDNPSGYRPEERAWMDEWFGNGFTDAYRSKYPEKIEFSWWSYRAGSRGKNKGWRIDYISVDNQLAEKIVDVTHYKDDQHSDHCALELILK